jgi:hypothetical protein
MMPFNECIVIQGLTLESRRKGTPLVATVVTLTRNMMSNGRTLSLAAFSTKRGKAEGGIATSTTFPARPGNTFRASSGGE